jgi:Na+-translocating ferredoxin:NAD+ oxidoreductase subunit B
MKENKDKSATRREFVKTAGRIIVAAPVLALPVFLSKKTDVTGYVWQIDPYKCTSCEQCKTLCIMTPSAVKCTNAFPMCGYCDFCPGFLRQGAKKYTTAAEDQLCPTGAIIRKFVEEPYFEYTIDEALCNGCSKCVKGCVDFGNGSLYLQIMHDLCLNCNQCAIARKCPSDAVIRVPATEAYIRKEQKSGVPPLRVTRGRVKSSPQVFPPVASSPLRFNGRKPGRLC